MLGRRDGQLDRSEVVRFSGHCPYLYYNYKIIIGIRRPYFLVVCQPEIRSYTFDEPVKEAETLVTWKKLSSRVELKGGRILAGGGRIPPSPPEFSLDFHQGGVGPPALS